MNGQLPHIDSNIREQLTRRAGGRLPEGLLAEVSVALDGVREPRASARWPRLTWSAPRLAAAGVSVALVAILAVAIAFPAFHTGPATSPAGYPVDRALTTDELARLMAGPRLPTNTTLVASVTIDARADVCPMNRYPTIGVVEGMGSQVCVMGATVSAYLSGPKATGIFAFRYMAPGYLGLLGEITPVSSSKLAFRVTDDWPLAGKTFLVEAWLVANPLPCPSMTEAPAGDPLDPSGSESCQWSWLSDDGSLGPGVGPSTDLLALMGKTRFVEAGGMRQIDSVPLEATHGVFVVRSITEQCPNASLQDNRGCGAWHVLAMVTADLTAAPATPSPAGSPTEAPPQTPVPEPTPSPTAPAETPHAGYPTDRALTIAEFAAVMAGPAPAANTTLVARVTINGRTYCPTDAYASIGVVEGMRSQVCVEGDILTLPKVTATFAFRYLRPGVLANLGQIEPASPSQLVHRGADGWPWGLAETHTFLVGGYLVRDPAGSRIVDAPGGPAPTGGGTYQTVVVDASAGIDSISPSQYGVFVVVAVWGSGPASSMGAQTDSIAFHVVARVADISVPGAKASPTPSPTAHPSAAPLGLLGPGGRALTANEMATIWATDPDHQVGRTAIVEGSVPGGFMCWSAGAADASASPGTCHVGILNNVIAGPGTWAVQIGADGTLRVLGEIATRGSGAVSLLTEALADRASDRLYLVWAYAVAEPDPACASGCDNLDESVWLSSDVVAVLPSKAFN